MPSFDRDASASIVAIWVAATSSWQFCEMHGLAFGFAASVLAFNRGPTLMVATARRCAGILCAAYVDDLPVIDTAECAPSAHIGLQNTLSLAEYEQSPGKAFGPSPYRTLLGVSVSFAQTAETGIVRMEPTTSTRQRIIDALNRALETLHLSLHRLQHFVNYWDGLPPQRSDALYASERTN